MTTRVFAQYRRPQSLADQIWMSIAAFLDHVAVINARNGATGPFGL